MTVNPRAAWHILLGVACSGCGYGEKLSYKECDLYYTSRVRTADAERLGDFLNAEGYFNSGRRSVQLDRRDGAFQVRFVYKKNYRTDKDHHRMLALLGGQIREAVFPGETIVLHLCDEKFKTEAVVEALHAHHENGSTVYYRHGEDDSARERVDPEEAAALARLFVEKKVFDGAGRWARLERNEAGYECWLVVKDEAIDNVRTREKFSELRFDMAQRVFPGKRVTLVLCSAVMERLRTFE